MARFPAFQDLDTRRQLMLGGGLLAVIAALLICGYWLWLRPSYEILFSELRPADAAAIVGELEKRKVPFRLEDDGTTILVPDAQVDAARLDVMSNDLPIKGMVGFELFNKSDMGLTEFAQKINYQRALQGELARTIMTIDGVDAARVHLSLSEPSIFKADRIPPKASVTLTMRPGAMLSAGAVQGIQRLVAASVPELDVAQVVVVDEQGEVVSPEPAMAVEMSSPFLQQKAAIEAFGIARVRDRLREAYPADSIDIVLWADIKADDRLELPASTMPGATQRDFRLVVTLTPHVALSDAARSDILARTAEAIDFDPSIGDVISFGAYAPKPSARLPRPALSRRSGGVEPTFSSSDAVPTAGLIGIGLIGVALLVAWGTRARMVARQRRRSAFVGRFQALLDQEGGNRVERS